MGERGRLPESERGLPAEQRASSPFVLEVAGADVDLTSRVLVVGILNRTPDSFYDKGRYFELEAALKRAEEMVEEGADVVDVGGQKAGPGDPVDPGEEADRVCPIIEHLASDGRVLVSVDTFVSSVAEAALASGAHIVNDISGLADPQMTKVVAEKSASLVITHIKGVPRVAEANPVYDDLLGEVEGFLSERVSRAVEGGVPPGRIIVDAGLDLGKSPDHSLALLKQTSRIVSMGHPVMASASNKPFIGESLGLAVDERMLPTLAAVSFAVAAGARLVRVHDVAQMKVGMRMLEAILES